MTMEALPTAKNKVEAPVIDYPEVIESRIGLSESLGLVCMRLSELEEAHREKVLNLIALSSENENISDTDQAHINMLRQELLMQSRQLARLSVVRTQITSDLIVNTRDIKARNLNPSDYVRLLQDPSNVNTDLFGEPADMADDQA